MRLFFHRFPAVGVLLLFALLCAAALASSRHFPSSAATLVVTKTADSGVGSLRRALADAHDGDTIQFDPALNGQAISLTSAELAIDKNITISGPGSNLLTLSRSTGTFRIFHIIASHTVVIERLTISGGYVLSEYGGGILNEGSTLTINSCSISGNASVSDQAAAAGGGIYNNGALTITNSVVNDNWAVFSNLFIGTGGSGGGIANGGTMTMTNTTVNHNMVGTSSGPPFPGGNGGGIANDGVLTITNSTISNNSSGRVSGGISNAGTLTISNSTISGNSAYGAHDAEVYGSGGGIGNNGMMTITNSTVGNNSAPQFGGGIGNSATLVITNTVLSANTVSNISSSGGTVTSHGYNLSSDGAGGFLTEPGDQININPLLGPLQDNGGTTFTHALLNGSPAIDMGDPNFTPPPYSDQRGYLRVYNGRIDVGSFEAQPPIGTTRIVTTVDDSGVGSLRDAIAAAQSGDTIQFAAALNGKTITLTSGELAIGKSVTIAGPGAGQLTVQRSTMAATPAFRIFEITPGRAVTIQGLTISHGYAPGGNPSEPGGGIYNRATLTINDCTLIDNRADELGGGIYNGYYGPILTMNNCTVNTNSAGNGGLGGFGGGIFNGGVLTATNCTFNGNSTIVGANGGGIYNTGSGALRNSTVSANLASYGGGIYNAGGITRLEVTNCTISANTAYTRGGGIYNEDGGLILADSTLNGNVANSSGGGIYNEGSPFRVTLEIGNNIFNRGAKGTNIVHASGMVTSHGYNLSSDNGGGFLTAPGDQINIEPLLGPLQNNGGPTATHALLPGSPAINAGDPNFTPPPSTDQRGYLRVFNGRIDIGSLEVQPVPSPTPTPTPAAQFLNLSTRVLVQTADRVGIGGFIITPSTIGSGPNGPSTGLGPNGSGGKQVLLRGIGPSLAQFGVPNALADPVMELHGPAGLTTIVNDNWRDSQAAAIIATDLAPTNDLESAILVTLDPGAYTAIVKGRNDTSGVALVEVYDLGPATSKLGNISTRAFVGTGGDVVIGGFILGGGATSQIEIHGIGPSLAGFGVQPALADPTLELRDSNGALLAFNDNCGDSPLAPHSRKHGPLPINDCTLHCSNVLEACIGVSLPPGTYTAILAGKNGDTGIGLVEIYNLN